MLNTQIYKQEMANRSTALVTLETAILVIIAVTALLGNLMVCWAVYRSKKLRTVSNLYIVVLAVCDISMALLCMPLSIEVFITADFVHGDEVAQAQGFFSFFLSLASLQTMTAMAINRFCRIVKPDLYRKYFKSVKNTGASVVVIIVLAAVSALLPLVCGFAKYTFHYGKVFSYIDYTTPTAAYIYTLFLKTCCITIPTLITLVCYYKIFLAVKSHAREMTRTNRRGATSPSGLAGRPVNVEEVNITKALFATVLGFVACWTPVAVTDLVDTFTNHTLTNPRQIYLFYIYMGYGSSSINPFIYGILNRSFRQEFIKILQPPRCYPRPSNEVAATQSGTKVTSQVGHVEVKLVSSQS